MLDICRRSAPRTVTKGKSMIGEEIGAQRLPRGRTASRRSRPISANTSSSSATRCRRTSSRRPCISPRRRSRPISAASTPICRPDRNLVEPTSLLAEARARAAREIPRRRCRHHRRQFPGRRDRHLDHRHQRGQRRPHPDAAQGAHRARQHREAGADAGGRGAVPARAGALGDRPGDVGLHHALDRPAPRRRSRRAGASITSSSSTTAARPCWAAISTTCCAASAAAPA